MAELKNAPKLYNSRAKLVKNFTQIDNDLVTICFKNLHYNAFKLFFLLQGTNEFKNKEQTEHFDIPEDFIFDRIGLDSADLSRARKELVTKGFIAYVKYQKYEILYDEIKKRYSITVDTTGVTDGLIPVGSTGSIPVETIGIQPVENTGVQPVDTTDKIDKKRNKDNREVTNNLAAADAAASDAYASGNSGKTIIDVCNLVSRITLMKNLDADEQFKYWITSQMGKYNLSFDELYTVYSKYFKIDAVNIEQRFGKISVTRQISICTIEAIEKYIAQK